MIMPIPRFIYNMLIIGLTIPLLAIAGPPSSTPPASPLNNISDQLEVLDTKVDTLQASVVAVDTKIDTLQAKVDLVMGAMMVPFRTTIKGGLCDSGGSNTSSAAINISGKKAGATFVVNSILIQIEDFTKLNQALSVNAIRVDGLYYSTLSVFIFDTLLNPLPGEGAGGPGFDLMGLRLEESPNRGSPGEGGVFPTQIVANSTNSIDILVQLFCRSDDIDWNIRRISVAGMKQVGDVISVSYTPGQ